MFKIKSIKTLENELLKDSSLDDIHGALSKKQDPDRKLSADDVQHDVSVLARYLIRAYAGWPVHNNITKRKVLNRLTKIYQSAHDMTAAELFESLEIVIGMIPDNHISIDFNHVHAKTKSERKHKNVGKNFAGRSAIKHKLRNDNIAIIGFNAMLKDDEFRDAIIKFQNEELPKSNALIIDLRGNSGGNSFYSDKFAQFLCGAPIDSVKKTYVRTTPEAQKLQQETSPNAKWKNLPKSEKLQLWIKGKYFKVDKNHAYMKPIFILTDEHTGSSAEMFLLRMLHHPMVTVVGDNSAGMEVYGNMGHGFLPHSNINIHVGMNYRILEYKNFELHGYTPNIMCDDGIDAMDMVFAELAKVHNIKLISHINSLEK